MAEKEYIEREALPAANMNDNDYADGWNECLEAINTIPAADVREVVRGEWIRHLDDRFGHKLNDCIECSCCRVWFSTEDMFRRSYCPNCARR